VNLIFTFWVFPGWRINFEGVILAVAKLEDCGTGPFAGKMDPYYHSGNMYQKTTVTA
jgi:hypothetical protein